MIWNVIDKGDKAINNNNSTSNVAYECEGTNVIEVIGLMATTLLQMP